MSATQQNFEQEILSGEIACYDPFRARIAQLKEINRQTVFDYEDEKGNKEARSHVFMLRKSKATIEATRKEAKAGALEYGRKVDAEAKSLMGEIEEMIDVHQKPIDEIAEREEKRVASIKARLENLAKYRECKGHDSAELVISLAELEAFVVDNGFGEFEQEAHRLIAVAIQAHQSELATAQKREADAAELERLRKEAAEREKADNEERFRKEGEDRARKQEQERQEQEHIIQFKREQDLKDAAAKAEQDRIDAEVKAEADKKRAAEQAEADKQKAIEDERKRAQQEAEAKAAEDAKREADKAHRATIHAGIIAALGKLNVSEETAKAIITAIAKSEIPNVKIQY